ncbi:MAG: hypothetical protein AB7P69_20950 [Candidatus Binatia bacterium]
MSDTVTYDPPVTVKAGQIQFVEACHPPLVAGAYKVNMSQVIKESQDAVVPWNSDPYASELALLVDAPRFTLNPTDIHSVYPPSNQTGAFDNALPHVVFTRRTLPWERTHDGNAPKLGQPFPPWLGLLLVQEDELLIRENDQTTNRKYAIRSLPVVRSETDKDRDSLLFPTEKNILVPKLGQNDPEKWKKEQERYEKDLCLTIDLPADLFKAIAPRIDDLPYLAHVRQIDTGDKEVQALNDRGWFSLIIGNRLPQADREHHVFLVSLEGHQDRLQETWRPEPRAMVRLAVLGSWSFKCEGTNDFKAHMQHLQIDSLHLPFTSFDDNSTTSAKDVVNGAYARGYTAFNHIMRQGEKTVSWYRGPLTPLNYDKPQQIQEPVSCADELLRYDPDTGLFDVTYAAAWQLGRLLAMQNHGFALALNRARRALRAEAERQMRLAEIEHLTNGKDSIEDSLMDQLAKDDGDKLKSAIPK